VRGDDPANAKIEARTQRGNETGKKEIVHIERLLKRPKVVNRKHRSGKQLSNVRLVDKKRNQEVWKILSANKRKEKESDNPSRVKVGGLLIRN